MDKLVRQTTFEDVKFHDTRHSHVPLILKQGIHHKIGQERLGHASIQITLDTYSYVVPGTSRAPVRFNETLTSVPKKAFVKNIRQLTVS